MCRKLLSFSNGGRHCSRSLGHTADSAGTHPAEKIASNAVKVLESRGISTAGMVPKNVEAFSADDYDMVISMGCGVHCLSYAHRPRLGS